MQAHANVPKEMQAYANVAKEMQAISFLKEEKFVVPEAIVWLH